MADNASRDENKVPTMLAVSESDNSSPVTLQANPTTHALIITSV